MGGTDPGRAQSALTARQREIAALVAEGLTNREIAQKLFVSERTVDGHMEQIRNKLGVRTRAQIVGWLVQNDVRSALRPSERPPAPLTVPGIPAPVVAAGATDTEAPVSRMWSPGLLRRRSVRFWAIAALVLVLVAVSSAGIWVVRQAQTGPTISTYAGLGPEGYTGDEGPAKSAILGLPRGVIVDQSGNVFIAETPRYVAPKIRVIDAKGYIHAVTETYLRGPNVGLAIDTDGNLYVAKANSQVLKVNRNFRAMAPVDAITIFAGTGQYGNSGDGGPATSALLRRPSGLAFDNVGNLYVADLDNHVVRRITPTGLITTFAGTGTAGYGGDGGPANQALLSSPAGLASDAKGNVYIADRSNYRIRVVAPNGIINTIAGNGIAGFRGDGSLAREAWLNQPNAVAVGANGDVYIADTLNNAIRRVHGDLITTIAGQPPRSGSSGDNGPAGSAFLNQPAAVALNSAGDILIADTWNNRIRVISRPAG